MRRALQAAARGLHDREDQPDGIDLNGLVTNPLRLVQPTDPAQGDVADQAGGDSGQAEHDQPCGYSPDVAAKPELGCDQCDPFERALMGQQMGHPEDTGRGRHHQRDHDRAYRLDRPRQEGQHQQRADAVHVPPIEGNHRAG